MAATDKPIIVIKKKGGHGGHHGGAWKIAYADFITAMMCFFLVMWLVNSAPSDTKEKIASYFRQPGLFEKGSGSPIQQGGLGILPEAYVPANQKKEIDKAESSQREMTDRPTTPTPIADLNMPKIDGKVVFQKEPESRLSATPPEGQSLSVPDNAQVQVFEKMAQQIREQIQSSPELQKLLGAVDVKIDADGLNIEIMDTEESSMFMIGSSQVQPEAREAFFKIASILSKVPNEIEVLGHTDAKPYSTRRGGYSNWELSVDRANSARKILQEDGIPPDRVRSVVGKADTELKIPSEPYAAANRRISLRLKFYLKKNIDFAKEGDELKSILQETPSPSVNDTPIAKIEPEEGRESSDSVVHELTTDDIIHGSKKQSEKIKLPEVVPTPVPDIYISKDKIFGENPVFGPKDFIGTR